MVKYTFILLTLLLSSINSYAQFNMNHKAFQYKTSEAIESELLDTTDIDEYYFQLTNRMNEFAFNGNYYKALEIEDLITGEQLYPTLTPEDVERFIAAEKTGAIDYILEQAASQQAVFINEAHHVPGHRAVVVSLLEGMYKVGYRYLGLEALGHFDDSLAIRGYPNLKSGYYTKELVNSELIREALLLGFTVFPYENQRQDHMAIDADQLDDREKGQAKNIAAIFDRDENAKVLVLAGYDHIVENENIEIGGYKPMAVQFREITGIDPLTIDQTYMRERFDYNNESPYFALFGYEDELSVFIEEDGHPFVAPDLAGSFDVQLFHPRVRYIDGRAEFLQYGRRKLTHEMTPNFRLKLPVLAKVYHEGDDPATDIPADILEITEISKFKKHFYVLAPGQYQVVFESIDGEVKTENLRVRRKIFED